MMISTFKDWHKNRRMFLIGNGPSLSTMDLSPLRNELTMTCNRGYAALGQPSTYWTLEDTLDAEQYSHELEHVSSIKFLPEDLLHVGRWGIVIPVPFVRGPFEHPTFSSEPPFQWGGTVMHLMIQLAVYMGVTDIILLGNDFKWSTDGVSVAPDGIWTVDHDVNHFDGAYWPKGFRAFPPNVRVMLDAFIAADAACRKLGVRIVNATPDSALPIFNRVNYGELFA